MQSKQNGKQDNKFKMRRGIGIWRRNVFNEYERSCPLSTRTGKRVNLKKQDMKWYLPC